MQPIEITAAPTGRHWSSQCSRKVQEAGVCMSTPNSPSCKLEIIYKPFLVCPFYCQSEQKNKTLNKGEAETQWGLQTRAVINFSTCGFRCIHNYFIVIF